MRYSVTSQITSKKSNPLSGVYRILVVLIALPVLAIASLSFIFYLIFSRLQSLFVKRTEAPDESFHIELALLTNDAVNITVTEDEQDLELTALNERWAEKVYHDQTYLYRARTSPVIPAIHDMIVCFYLKEQPDGAILQLLNDYQNMQLPTTQLVYLRYSDMQVTLIGNIGSFYLYNDEKRDDIIRGFNNDEEVVIKITAVAQNPPLPLRGGDITSS